MELSIIRRETTGTPPNQYNESETITKFEIMDGAPVRGIPPFAPSLGLGIDDRSSPIKAKQSLFGYSSAGLT